MKYVYVILLVLCCLGCKSTKVAPETSTYEGVLKVQGITTYQYGTHTLTNENDVYALTSDTIILDDFDSEYPWLGYWDMKPDDETGLYYFGGFFIWDEVK